jgi:dephospho-CoA kinase
MGRAGSICRIGLTGGIASGKSSVADLFVSLGAALVDTDAVAREVVARGTPGLEAVRSELGEGVLTPDGELDRGQVRTMIFADASVRRRLEAILHPRIRQRTLGLMRDATGPYVLVAVPLLVETDFAALVDRVLVVDCAVETQIRRLMQPDNISEADAKAVIAAQADRAQRLDAADDVIDNTGAPEATAQQVERLHASYLAMAAARDCRSKRGRAE